ncbi:unnamed protein product [Sphagnum balticum]
MERLKPSASQEAARIRQISNTTQITTPDKDTLKPLRAQTSREYRSQKTTQQDTQKAAKFISALLACPMRRVANILPMAVRAELEQPPEVPAPTMMTPDNPNETLGHVAAIHGLLGLLGGEVGHEKPQFEKEKHDRILEHAKEAHVTRTLPIESESGSDSKNLSFQVSVANLEIICLKGTTKALRSYSIKHHWRDL